MYTDGIVEGRVGEGPERVGGGRLRRIAEESMAADPGWRERPASLLDGLLDAVEALAAGPPADDVAMLLIGNRPGRVGAARGAGAGERGPLARRRGLRARLSALSVGRLLSLTIGVLLVLAAIGIGLALVASIRLSHQRSFLLDQAGPSSRASLELENALVNEETGIRGYLITVESQFLDPYGKGLGAEAASYKTLEAHQRQLGAPVPAEVAAVRVAAKRWKHDFVARALREPRGVDRPRGRARRARTPAVRHVAHAADRAARHA